MLRPRSASRDPAIQLQSGAFRHQWPHPKRGAEWQRRRLVISTMEPSLEEEPRERRMARLEAILFLSRDPLNSRRLAQHANLADGTEARTLIRLLNQRYDDTSCAFRIEEVGGGFQLFTRPMFATWLRRLQHLGPEVRLTPPAMETLAVVAYRQPVQRAEIEAIRGVSSGEMLRQLMERELVRVSGRSEELGRPYLYSTTKAFLRLFGLSNLDALPKINPLRLHHENPVTATSPTESARPSTQDESKEESDKESTVTVMPADVQEEFVLETSPLPENAAASATRLTANPRMEDDDFEEEEEGDEEEDGDEEWDEGEDEEYEDGDEEEDEDEDYDDYEDYESEDEEGEEYEEYEEEDDEWEEVEDDESDEEEVDDEEWEEEEEGWEEDGDEEWDEEGEEDGEEEEEGDSWE